MDRLLQDFRYALRTLARSPGFTAAAVVTLALGIGATTLVFSMVNGILIRPFPYEDPDRLVQLTEIDKNDQYFAISYPNFVDYRAGVSSVTALAGVNRATFTIRGETGPERIEGAAVSYNMFDVLGIRPVLGRTFRAEEDRPGGERVVLIGHGLWQRSFGGARDVVGRVVNVQGEPHVVIGVMPPDFKFPTVAEAWLPMRRDPTVERGHRYMQSIGRLKPGATVARVQQEAESVAKGIEAQHPRTVGDWRPLVSELQSFTTKDVKPVLYIMLAAVGFVLLIACANVANLLLARAATRDKEIAIRTALGASRTRLFSQLLTESAVLGLAGGGLGALFATWWMDLVLRVLPGAKPFWMRFEIDATVLLFTLALALTTAFVFGLAPALHTMRADLQTTLKEGRGSTGTRRKTRLRGTLVVAQLALAVTLLVGGLLMARSFLAMRNVDPGFRSDNITSFNLELPGSLYEVPQQRVQFYEQLRQRIAALPRVEGVGAVSNLPIGGREVTGNFSVQGRTEPIEDQASRLVISPGYFEAMSIPVLRGRAFDRRDNADAEPVAIINQRVAQFYFPNTDAIGKRISFGAGDDVLWRTIVGVVRNINQKNVGQKAMSSDIYLPMAQAPERFMSVVVRSPAPLESVVPLVRREVQALDPNIPLFSVKSMGRVLDENVADARLSSSLFAAFALAALLLAAVGLYGVIAFAVAQRTREIGVRIALGAHPAAVLRLIVGQGARFALAGIALGLLGALAMGRAMANLLFGVTPTDPLTFLIVPVLLCAVALLASYIPARRALRVDPMTALRLE
jgi:putative ABC transport system permease protein